MTDKFVENILIEWGMPELIEVFKNEAIDEEAFKLLENQTVDYLIPKIGVRLKFKSKFKNMYVENWITNSEAHGTASATTKTVSSPSMTSGSFNSSIENSTEVTKYFILDQNNIQDMDMDMDSSALFMPPPELIPTQACFLKKQLTSSVFSKNLETLLLQSVDGRLVLMKKETGLLDNNLRNKLVNIIIHELLNIDKTIAPNTFLRVAEEICTLFNKEDVETYYIPYSPKSKTSSKIQPKGKLYSRYVNLKSAIKTVNGVPSTSNKLLQENVFTSEITDEENSYLTFLKSALEPREQILSCWKKTFAARKPISSDKSIGEYFNLYPALKENDGYILLELDFDQVYPDKTDVIYSTFPKIAEAIIQEAEKRKIKLPHLRDRCVDGIIDRHFLALLYLPYLFSPITLGGAKKSKNWRPSKLEVQESFLLNISNIGFLNEKLEDRKIRLRKLNLTVQPLIVCVGVETITSCFVIIDDIKYKLETPIKALDVAFKLFHTVNAEYPAECQHVWLLIQRLVYGINTVYDKPSSATTALISDLSSLIDQTKSTIVT